MSQNNSLSVNASARSHIDRTSNIPKSASSFQSPIAADPEEYRHSVIFNDDGSLKALKSAVPTPGSLDVRRTTMMSMSSYIPSFTVEVAPAGYPTFVSLFGNGFPVFSESDLAKYEELQKQISNELYREIIAGINERFAGGNRVSFIIHMIALVFFIIGVAFLIGLFFVSPLLIPCIIFFILSVATLVGARVFISKVRKDNILSAIQYLSDVNSKHGKDGRMRWKLLQDDEIKSNSDDWPFVLEVFLTPIPNKEDSKGHIVRLDVGSD